ncbi:MAG: glycosyltransferase [Clostridiales bacterium]|nr:glycosyltransferase [Clostridiales bacterium]
MSAPLVSIIVPVYRVEAWLERCIQSLINQTLRDIEIILVDDGSPDNCPAICNAAAARDKRIRVIHKENGGVSSARNAGLDVCSGTYISFIDSDDHIEPEMIEKMVAAMEQSSSQVAICNIYRHSADGIRQHHLSLLKGTVSFEGKTMENFYNVFGIGISPFLWNKLFYRDIIENHHLRFEDMEKIWSEDQLFLYCYFCFVKKAVFLDDSLYHYYVRDNTLSHYSVNTKLLNQWTTMISEIKSFVSREQPSFAPPSYFYSRILWDYFCVVCQKAGSKENLIVAIESMEPANYQKLKQTFASIAFGTAGRYISKVQHLSLKATLYFRFMGLLLWLGRIDRPLNTFLLSQM